jgi:hypothetical protein
MIEAIHVQGSLLMLLPLQPFMHLASLVSRKSLIVSRVGLAAVVIGITLLLFCFKLFLPFAVCRKVPWSTLVTFAAVVCVSLNELHFQLTVLWCYFLLFPFTLIMLAFISSFLCFALLVVGAFVETFVGL